MTHLISAFTLNPTDQVLEASLDGQRIDYIRVSSLDQNDKRQLDGQVLDRVFTDKASDRDYRQTPAS